MSDPDDELLANCRQIMREGLDSLLNELTSSLSDYFADPERIQRIISVALSGGGEVINAGAQGVFAVGGTGESLVKSEPTTAAQPEKKSPRVSPAAAGRTNVCLPANLREQLTPIKPVVKIEQPTPPKPKVTIPIPRSSSQQTITSTPVPASRPTPPPPSRRGGASQSQQQQRRPPQQQQQSAAQRSKPRISRIPRQGFGSLSHAYATNTMVEDEWDHPEDEDKARKDRVMAYLDTHKEIQYSKSGQLK